MVLMSTSSISDKIKDAIDVIKSALPFVFFILIYFLIAAVAFHFIHRAGFNFYLSLAGSLLWPLALLAALAVLSGGP